MTQLNVGLLTMLPKRSSQTYKGKGKLVPMLNEAPRHEDILGGRYNTAHF